MALEIIGSIIGIAYVYFEWKERPVMWLFGVLMPIAYLIVFFQRGLYANAAIQAYYIIASFYGLLLWQGILKDRRNPDATTHIKSLSLSGWLLFIGVTVLLTALITFVLCRLPGESDQPFLDGFTASLNILGMWLLAKKYYQQWYVWLLVNPITVVLCLLNEMYTVAAFYAIAFGMSILGYNSWLKKYRSCNTTM